MVSGRFYEIFFGQENTVVKHKIRMPSGLHEYKEVKKRVQMSANLLIQSQEKSVKTKGVQ